MPRKTPQDPRFRAPNLDDQQRTRRTLELIYGQDVTEEDSKNNMELDRYGEEV